MNGVKVVPLWDAAKLTHGTGWQHLSQRQKRGEFAIIALSALSAQDESIPRERLQALIDVYAGEALDGRDVK